MIPTIIAVDPGLGGGIAISRAGIVEAYNMPDTFSGIFDDFYSIAASSFATKAYVEKVGMYVKGNSGPSAAKFARHCGHVEMALYGAHISTIQFSPQKWMKKLMTLPKDKGDRKRAIKNEMQTMYPHIKVTLKIADALGILTVAMRGDLG